MAAPLRPAWAWAVRTVLALHVIAAAVLGVQAVRQPFGNWDMVPYTAIVKRAQGLAGRQLLEATYADLRAWLPADRYRALVDGPPQAYQVRVAQDPEALRQNLRFYEVKPLYLALVRATAAATGTVAQASVLVSAVAFSLALALFPLLLRRRLVAVAGIWLLVTLGTPPFTMLASCATPDTLALLFAGGAALVAVRWQQPLLVTVLALLAVLARPDTMFLLGPLLLGLAWLQRRERTGKAFAALLVAASALFLVLGLQALPWSTLIHHTFVERLSHPEQARFHVGVAQYLAIVAQTLPQAASLRVVLIFAAALALALWPWLRRRQVTAAQVLAAAAAANMVLHFLFFPVDEFGHERLFLGSYVLVLAAGVMLLAWPAAGAGRAPTPALPQRGREQETSLGHLAGVPGAQGQAREPGHQHEQRHARE